MTLGFVRARSYLAKLIESHGISALATTEAGLVASFSRVAGLITEAYARLARGRSLKQGT